MEEERGSAFRLPMILNRGVSTRNKELPIFIQRERDILLFKVQFLPAFENQRTMELPGKRSPICNFAQRATLLDSDRHCSYKFAPPIQSITDSVAFIGRLMEDLPGFRSEGQAMRMILALQ